MKTVTSTESVTMRRKTQNKHTGKNRKESGNMKNPGNQFHGNSGASRFFNATKGGNGSGVQARTDQMH